MTFAVRENAEARIVFRRVIDLDNELQQTIRTGFFFFMRALQTRAQKSIRAKDKRGRVYRVRNPRTGRVKTHRSSAPGQSHARMFGPLGDSISWRVEGWDKATFGYGVSTTRRKKAPPYAGAIEFGSKKLRIKPRPTLLNASNAEDIQPHFDRAFAQSDLP